MRKSEAKAAKRSAKAERQSRPGVPVFFCESTGEATVWNGFGCKCGEYFRRRVEGRFTKETRPAFPSGATAECPKCGKPAELSSQGYDTIYRRHDTGEEVNPEGEKLPPGACWASDPENAFRPGPDGRELRVMLPNGISWCIDSRANNCKFPDDNEHYCWGRTGRPEDGTLHVVKGKEGDAGAGSILAGNYHGFLRHGQLVLA